MAIRDESAQSYGWSATLSRDVPDGESVDVPAPGFDVDYTDTRHAEATLSSWGAVWSAESNLVEISFDETKGAEKATVTNRTGQTWPARDDIYVFCPHLLAEGHNDWDLKGQIWDLQQRVSALEGGSTGSEGRSRTITRTTIASEPGKASSNPSPPPHRANIPPVKPPNAPHGSFIAPQRPK